MSLGQLCGADVTIVLTRHELRFYNNDNFDTIVMEGTRNTPDGMWHLKLEPRPIAATRTKINRHQANSAYELKKKNNITKIVLQTMCNPAPSTWKKAIDAGFFCHLARINFRSG